MTNVFSGRLRLPQMQPIRLIALFSAILFLLVTGCDGSPPTNAGKAAADLSGDRTDISQSAEPAVNDDASDERKKASDMERVKRDARAYAEERAAAEKKTAEDRAQIAGEKISNRPEADGGATPVRSEYRTE